MLQRGGKEKSNKKKQTKLRVNIERQISRYGFEPQWESDITFFCVLWGFQVVSPDFAKTLQTRFTP